MGTMGPRTPGFGEITKACTHWPGLQEWMVPLGHALGLSTSGQHHLSLYAFLTLITALRGKEMGTLFSSSSRDPFLSRTHLFWNSSKTLLVDTHKTNLTYTVLALEILSKM